MGLGGPCDFVVTPVPIGLLSGTVLDKNFPSPLFHDGFDESNLVSGLDN